MTKQTDAAEAERKVMAKYEARLAKAEQDAYYTLKGQAAGSVEWIEMTTQVKASEYLRILRASAAALYPGTQKRKHLLEALGKMVTAACRVIRKGAK